MFELSPVWEGRSVETSKGEKGTRARGTGVDNIAFKNLAKEGYKGGKGLYDPKSVNPRTEKFAKQGGERLLVKSKGGWELSVAGLSILGYRSSRIIKRGERKGGPNP